MSPALVSMLLALPGCYRTHSFGPEAGDDAGRPFDALILADAGIRADAATVDAHVPEVATESPRPLAPLSTSTVTSSRPTLRWVLPPGQVEGRVELCRERDCADPLETLTGTTRARPSRDLPPGWYFWRVTSGMRVSATWQFRVGLRTTPVDTSWGVALDVNGDGYLDEVRNVSDGSTRAGVFYGTATGFEMEPAVVIPTICNGGAYVSAPGDVNGDGFGDLLLRSSPYEWCRPNLAHVYLGGPGGISERPQHIIDDFPESQYRSFDAIGAGDLNGDGYGDIALSSQWIGTITARVWFGSARGIEAARGLELPTPEVPTPEGRPREISLRAGMLLAAGDVNGDRLADLCVGPWVFLGGATGFGTPSFTFDGFAKAAAVADVNGDGFADWAVSSDLVSSDPARVSVFHGGSSGFSAPPATTLLGSDQYFANTVELVDLNADGFSDLIASQPSGGGPPAPRRYYGSPAGLIVE